MRAGCADHTWRQFVPALVALLLAAAWGSFLYEPWLGDSFPVGDFSEFLPFVRHGGSFAGTLRGFVRHYGEHGRFNVLQYALFSAMSRAFGPNIALWQIGRGVQMLGILVAVYALVRRLGAERAAAALGAAVLLCGSGASATWIRLTSGEPLVVSFLLVAAHCAVGFQTSRRWPARAVAIALCCAGVVLTKEALVVTVPFAVGLALCFRGPNEWGWPALGSRRNQLLVLLAAIGVGVAMVPVALALRHARAGGYVSNYSLSHAGLGSFARLLWTMLVPINLTAEVPQGLRGVALVVDTLFVLTAAAGWVALWRRRGGRQVLFPLLLAVGIPVALAFVYLPWDGVLGVYLLPALLGQAVLLAFALEGIREVLPRAWPLAVEAAGLGLVGASALAHYEARQFLAARGVDAEIVGAVRRIASRQAMVVAGPEERVPRPPNQWVGKGPTLRRHVAALYDEDLFPVTDVGCELIPALRRQAIPVVVYAPDCGLVPGPRLVARRYFAYLDAQHLRVAQDSVRADILAPADVAPAYDPGARRPSPAAVATSAPTFGRRSIGSSAGS